MIYDIVSSDVSIQNKKMQIYLTTWDRHIKEKANELMKTPRLFRILLGRGNQKEESNLKPYSITPYTKRIIRLMIRATKPKDEIPTRRL